jgi:AmmeMemoRadiSam system protein B
MGMRLNLSGLTRKRIFLLGPSHHIYLSGCALSDCESYETPLGDLKLDRKTISELQATRKFDTMSLQTDEDEHSLEMHLPDIYKVHSRYLPVSLRLMDLTLLNVF